MKTKFVLLSIIWLLFFLNSALGDNNRRLSVSTGYYADYFYSSGDPGFIIKGNYGFRMKNNVWIDFELAQTEVRYSFTREPFFTMPGIITETHRWFGIAFSKDIVLKDKHIVKPMIGPVYSQFVFPYPQYYVTRIGNDNILEFKLQGETMHDIGFMINLSYLYEVNSNLHIGFVSGSNFILGLNLEGFYAAPKIEVRF